MTLRAESFGTVADMIKDPLDKADFYLIKVQRLSH